MKHCNILVRVEGTKTYNDKTERLLKNCRRYMQMKKSDVFKDQTEN